MAQSVRIDSCPAPTRSFKAMAWLGSICVLHAIASPPSARAQQASDNSVIAYAKEIAAVQSDLDAGRATAASDRLNATDKSLRSFEFEYLLARSKAAGAEGVAAPDLIRTIPRPEVEDRYGVLNEVNRQLVRICRDGSLRVSDLADSDNAVKVFEHPQASAIWSAAYSRDGKSFFAGHENGEVRVWDAARWELRHTVAVGTKWPVREIAAAPDGSAFVAENQKELELWSLAEKEPKKVAGVGERYNFGEGLAFSPRGDLIATGGMFDINLHDAKSGKLTHSMQHASYTMGLEFSPDGKRIASAPRGNVNRFLAVFDVDGDQPRFNAGPFGNYIAGMAFSPDGKRIAATGCEKMVRIFDAETGAIVLTLARPECGAKPAFSSDGKVLGWSEPGGYQVIELGKKPGSRAEKDRSK